MTEELKKETARQILKWAKAFSDLEEFFKNGLIGRVDVVNALMEFIAAAKEMVVLLYPDGHEEYGREIDEIRQQSIN